jgi:pyruvyltransferase
LPRVFGFPVPDRAWAGLRDVREVQSMLSRSRPVVLERWTQPNRPDNFGDRLAGVVCEAMLALQGLTPSSPSVRPRHLWSVGSVVHFARGRDVIWGSGVNGKDLNAGVSPLLDVRAVRGPLTQRWLTERGIAECEVFGDPALLLPQLMPELIELRNSGRRVEALVVPHLTDRLRVSTPLPILDVFSPWLTCICRIITADFVISSSLHGIIVAEAFGVPARLLRLSEHEPLFKYQDYFESTSRSEIVYATSVVEALTLGGQAPGAIDTGGLFRSFPYDLWRRPRS